MMSGGGKAMIFAGMGIEALVAVLAGFWGGKQIDSFLGNKGFGPALGSILMLVAWFVHFLVVLKKFEKDEES